MRLRCVSLMPFCASAGGVPRVARIMQVWQTPLRQEEGTATPCRVSASSLLSFSCSVLLWWSFVFFGLVFFLLCGFFCDCGCNLCWPLTCFCVCLVCFVFVVWFC